jgi:hypothetical protein
MRQGRHAQQFSGQTRQRRFDCAHGVAADAQVDRLQAAPARVTVALVIP